MFNNTQNIPLDVSRFTMFFVYLQLDLSHCAVNCAKTEH